MEVSKKFLHDRIVLLLLTIAAALLVIGVSLVFLRFDVSKNPTTIVAYRPNLSGNSYVSGKPIDIYSLAVFMVFTCVAATILSARIYKVRRYLSIFILSAAIFQVILATIVANALISLQ